jgi:hypothetical protein
MTDPAREVAALLDAALDLLRQVAPEGAVAVAKLSTQFDAWKTRQGPAGEGSTHIEIGSILSHQRKVGLVEIVVGREKVQLDLDKAREIAGMLGGAIEAAISDQLLYAFLTTKAGLTADQASACLLDFRELRQGSRGTVYPS